MGAEQRKFPRHRIELVAQIWMVDGLTTRAVLLDLSETGVRLKVPNPHILPEQFLLKMDSRIQRWARIIWRSDQEIGVEFLQAPQAPGEPAIKRAVLITCPNTGRQISTGIWLTGPSDLTNISNVRRLTQCPHCKVVHGWTPAEAVVEEAENS